MTGTYIVVMIFALVFVLIAANGIEQYKARVEHERHQLLLHLASVLNENDELLTNMVQLPMSNVLIATLVKRNIDVMEQIIELLPDSTRMPPRLEESKRHLDTIDTDIKGRPELIIPGNDEHAAALIATIKKLRHILLRQKRKGNISIQNFNDEDQVLSFFLLKVFVEYKINQGIYAVSDAQYGSARQFFEKALKILNNESAYPEYVKTKTAEVYERLESIAGILKDAGGYSDTDDDGDKPKDSFEDLEMVFNQTKKKW